MPLIRQEPTCHSGIEGPLGGSSLSTRTQGLLPVNAENDIGGFTLSNWDFLTDGAIWTAMLNSFLIAVAMVIGVGIVSTEDMIQQMVNLV